RLMSAMRKSSKTSSTTGLARPRHLPLSKCCPTPSSWTESFAMLGRLYCIAQQT
ncbi:hypothetical protein GGI21_001625, partial [Coemansia aciculifera]